MKILLFIFTLLFLQSDLPALGTWVFEEAFPSYSSEAGTKLYFKNGDRFSGIAASFLHLRSGYRLLLELKWNPIPYKPNVSVHLKTSGGEDKVIEARLLKGGHRIDIPRGSSEDLVSALLEGQSVNLTIGTYSITLTPNDFPSAWRRFNH